MTIPSNAVKHLHAAKRPDVGLRVHALTARLLGRMYVAVPRMTPVRVIAES
jgi:hypothetical protein